MKGGNRAGYPDALSKQDGELLDGVLYAYERLRLGPMRRTVSSTKREVGVVRDLVTFSCLPPWQWTEELFGQWCLHIGGERQFSFATQRSYQGSIKRFLDYLCSSRYHVSRIQKATGLTPRQVVVVDVLPHRIAEGGAA